MEISYIVSVINSLIGVLLLALTYTYLDKLEKIGCWCAEHKYRNFIKTFTMVAIVYLVLTMFIPPAQLARMFGQPVGQALQLLHFLFAIAFIFYVVASIMYVRYLMKEKCRCSEDIRREILYFVSILEVLILFTAVVALFLASITSSALVLTMNTYKDAKAYENTVIDTMRNPLTAAKKLPGSFKKLPNAFKKNFDLKKGRK